MPKYIDFSNYGLERCIDAACIQEVRINEIHYDTEPNKYELLLTKENGELVGIVLESQAECQALHDYVAGELGITFVKPTNPIV